MTSTESTATINALVKDLRKLALDLEKDLKIRARDDEEISERLTNEYEAARAAERTAASYTEWLGGRVTQAAAAWVLSTVFVRYCEDNGLIERRFLAGPLNLVEEAEEYQNAFTAKNPTLNNRDWLEAAFRHIADAHPTAAGLFDPRHNPLWDITISYETANDLIAFWRRRDDSGTTIRYDFTGWDTRFLGDLYQDLSEAARKTYALLQTPEFVEEFILDLTLDPAIEEFGLEGLRTIDPASGSGHFLLGMFHRILTRWRQWEPGTDDWELIRRSMESVHGCDKNPFATTIARFRLLLAAIFAAGETRLDRAKNFPINVAVGDSLIHGRDVIGDQGDLLDEEWEQHTYSTEDVFEYVDSCDMLDKTSYHVVVANPPYITVKDERENRLYRRNYNACAGTFALSVPFAQRLFRLAVRTDGSNGSSGAGLVGQITANSFMKREFGKKLIEKYFPNVQLEAVIDTSGAYIPGHGTPTVILIGRNHYGRTSAPVRTVLGIRGEPIQPADPAAGLVWTAITRQITEPGSESDWVSVADLPRERFQSYPWSLGGGGASGVLQIIEKLSSQTLEKVIAETGFGAVTRGDDVYMIGSGAGYRAGIEPAQILPIVEGETVRDFSISSPKFSVWPYSAETLKVVSGPRLQYWFWPYRFSLRGRVAYGKTQVERGLQWYEYSMFFTKRFRRPSTIAFAFVATHNHFVLDRGGKVFHQSAPVIKLPAGASESDHLALLGVLNSSVACFWLKQVCHDKGSQGVSEGFKSQAWERFYEFTGTKLQGFPLPSNLPLDLSRDLDALAQRLAEQEPSVVCDRGVPTRSTLDLAQTEHSRIRQRMIALQEELDWEVYQSYGLLSDAEVKTVRTENPEPLALGERAFEIVLARKVESGETETAWFERHRSTPITELPAHWSADYKKIVEARIAIIESRRDIALIERPECKRRWASDPWEKKEAAALRTWLLDRCEDRSLWFAMLQGIEQPRTMTVSRLADRFPPDSDVHAVAALYAEDHLGRRDMTLAQVLEKIVADEHVPYLAAMRYKESGLETRAEWERTWEGQREEDRTGENLNLPVPPKYKPADFRKTSYWSHRGKLDVPKERFVSYPEASPDADPTLLLGWAGWDHKDQAQALVNLVNDRSTQAGWPTERIVPLLAGLAELMPWVHQWHGEYDPEWDGNPAEEYQTFLDQQRAERQLTEQALRDWRPAAPTRGRRPRSTS